MEMPVVALTLGYPAGIDGRRFEYLVKRNPRKQDPSDWILRADQAGAWREARPGKRVALLDLTVERAWPNRPGAFA